MYSIKEVLKRPKIVVPKSKRNIFIRDKRFYLNIPELTFFDNGELYVWIIKDNQPHYVPLPNIAMKGDVCLERAITNLKEKVDYFFTSYFDCPYEISYRAFAYYHLSKYIFKYDKQHVKSKTDETRLDTTQILNQTRLQFYFDNPIPCKLQI